MLPISNNHPASALREGTPSPDEQRANPVRDAFLSAMGREDLVTVARFLDEQIGLAQWAFTGSTALAIHAHAAGKALGREPGDVDVLVDANRLNIFVANKIAANWQQAGLGFHRDEEGHVKHHILTLQRTGRAPLSIDLIEDGKDKVFGTLNNVDLNLRSACRISLLTPAALATSLENRKASGEAGENTDHDLRWIDGLLQTPQAGSSLEALALSSDGQPIGRVRCLPTLDSETPGPSAKRHRGSQE